MNPKLILPRRFEDVAEDFIKATDEFVGAAECLDAEGMTQAGRKVFNYMNEMRRDVRTRRKSTSFGQAGIKRSGD